MESYFPLRIEDFVLEMDQNQDGCFALFLRFVNHPLRGERLGGPDSPRRTAYAKLFHDVRALFRGHRRPYGGSKAGGVQNQRDIMRALYRGDPKSTTEDYFGIPLFGYKKHTWGIETSCEDWIGELERKGMVYVESHARVNETTNEVHAVGRKDWRNRH